MRLIQGKYSLPALQSPMVNNPGIDFHTQSCPTKRIACEQNITTSKASR